MQKAFVSWSGGKDSCFACYRAVKSGLDVRCLLNMVTEDGDISWSHGISSELLRLQAEAIDIPLIQKRTTAANYEKAFVDVLQQFKKEGISTGVFGDIDFNEHRTWIERVCSQGGVKSRLPLWGEDQEKLVKEFIDSGFETVVVTTKADLLGEKWLGRRIDRSFLKDLKALGNVTPCGEAGEYHTFVLDGPLFKKRIDLLKTEKELKDGYWFLSIKKCELSEK